jgi:predicted glycosyltransferase
VSEQSIFLYVQHLLGIGHLRRTATLANALAAQGAKVTLASGGFPVPGLALNGVTFVQLPPASAADATFKVLIGADGKPVDESWKTDRRNRLLEAWRAANAHALIVELYPFGRRQMRFELVPLIEDAINRRPRPLLISSVRDVLGGGQKDPARQESMLVVFERYFDRLLVHSDPTVIPFGLTFRHTDRIRDRLEYTGYIVERQSAPAGTSGQPGAAGLEEVIVSAGGGAVGSRLLETALLARRFSGLGSRTWRILTGVNAPETTLASLTAAGRMASPGPFVVERSREDFPQLLQNCLVSVSQGGYNTVMDLIEANARAVIVPFAGSDETEQTVRARAFAEKGYVEVVEESALTPERLAAAVDLAYGKPSQDRSKIDLDGAHRSARLVQKWIAGMRP